MTEISYYKQVMLHLENITNIQNKIIRHYQKGPLSRLWDTYTCNFSVEDMMMCELEERAKLDELISLKSEIVNKE